MKFELVLEEIIFRFRDNLDIELKKKKKRVRNVSVLKFSILKVLFIAVRGIG